MPPGSHHRLDELGPLGADANGAVGARLPARRSPPARRLASITAARSAAPVSMSYGPWRLDCAGAAVVIADDAVVARELGGDRVVDRGVKDGIGGQDHQRALAALLPVDLDPVLALKPRPRARFSQVRAGNGCGELRVRAEEEVR